MVKRHKSRVMRKLDFCLCENKGADQLRSNCEADQHLCFRYMDSTIPLLLKSEISSFYPSCVAVQANLFRTWSETPKTGFLASQLIYCLSLNTSLASLHFGHSATKMLYFPYKNALLKKYFTENGQMDKRFQHLSLNKKDPQSS